MKARGRALAERRSLEKNYVRPGKPLRVLAPEEKHLPVSQQRRGYPDPGRVQSRARRPFPGGRVEELGLGNPRGCLGAAPRSAHRQDPPVGQQERRVARPADLKSPDRGELLGYRIEDLRGGQSLEIRRPRRPEAPAQEHASVGEQGRPMAPAPAGGEQ